MRQATVVLPSPGVLLSRVDHDRTKTWEVTKWQDRAHRRLLAASKSLAAVRKLLPKGS